MYTIAQFRLETGQERIRAKCVLDSEGVFSFSVALAFSRMTVYHIHKCGVIVKPEEIHVVGDPSDLRPVCEELGLQLKNAVVVYDMDHLGEMEAWQQVCNI